jgi:hypothetical protein
MNEQRTDQQQYRRAIPFHPVLFAVAPILFVYAYNAARIPINPAELLLPVALSLGMTAVVWTITSFALRSATRAALVVSLFLLLFFSYGHVAATLGPYGQSWADLLLFWVLLLAAGTWMAARRPKSAASDRQFGLTVLLNCVATAVLVVNVMTGVPAIARNRRYFVRSTREAGLTAGREYPDIYYIILDGYARSDVLKSHYRTDNTAFLDELERLGFFVATRANSNYAQTYLSLASSLNFTYLDSLVEALGSKSGDHGPLIDMIQNSRVVDFLRRHNYTVVSFATGLTGTDLACAHVHLASRWELSEFQTVLQQTTLLRDILFPLLRKTPADLHRERVLYTLDMLPDAASGRHPAFVWAHIVSPHPPFIFNARGERPDASHFLRRDELQAWRTQSVTSTLAPRWYDEYYGPQVVYLNTLVEATVRQILAQSQRPPIIIIQGDHGPGSLPGWNMPRRQLLEQHAILYAAYLPPSDRQTQPPAQLYDSISPVNTFRVVLSTYFDTTMSLLPDRSYLSIWLHPYHLYDAAYPDSYPATNRPARQGSDTGAALR